MHMYDLTSVSQHVSFTYLHMYLLAYICRVYARSDQCKLTCLIYIHAYVRSDQCKPTCLIYIHAYVSARVYLSCICVFAFCWSPLVSASRSISVSLKRSLQLWFGLDSTQGRSDGGIWVFIPPKSVQVNYGVKMTSERLFNSFIPPQQKKLLYPPKQISSYAPDSTVT